NYQVTVGPLSDGIRQITATATDPVGNVSDPSGVLALTIDTTPPGPPSTPTLDAGSDGGALGDNITNDNTPTLDGGAEADSTVTIFSDGLAVGSGVADAGNNYAVTVSALTDGTHSVTASAVDAAGNVSDIFGALSLTIDTQAPALSNVAAV